MAVFHNNPILKMAQGMIGDLVVFRQVRGRTIMQMKPKRPTRESALQKANRTRFAAASAFARKVMLDPELKMQYTLEAARMKLPNPYTAALTLKLREWRDAVRKAEKKQKLNLQKLTEAADVNDASKAEQRKERCDERTLYPETNTPALQNVIEESLENAMQELQKAITKVHQLLASGTPSYHSTLKNVSLQSGIAEYQQCSHTKVNEVGSAKFLLRNKSPIP